MVCGRFIVQLSAGRQLNVSHYSLFTAIKHHALLCEALNFLPLSPMEHGSAPTQAFPAYFGQSPTDGSGFPKKGPIYSRCSTAGATGGSTTPTHTCRVAVQRHRPAPNRPLRGARRRRPARARHSLLPFRVQGRRPLRPTRPPSGLEDMAPSRTSMRLARPWARRSPCLLCGTRCKRGMLGVRSPR